MNVLNIQNLSKNYGKVQALNKLNLQINAGQVYGILGPNGSGKTTTLAIILGILKKTSGSFEWFEGKYKNPNKKIGAILETPNFYPYKNADQNLEIVKHIKGSNEKNFDEYLELVDLKDRRKSDFKQYSLGMKQRLAIAATLIGNPEVIIFDEPTNGLDPQGIAEVRKILHNVASSGKTILLASHILDEVEKICDHLAIIKKGKLLGAGSVNDILSNDITLEIGAINMENLKHFLNNFSGISDIKAFNNFYRCSLDDTIKIEDFSKTAFENGIIITHLNSRKQRLEEAFLEITNNA